MHSFVMHSEIQCWPEFSDESVLTIRIPVSVLGNKDNSSDANTPKKSVNLILLHNHSIDLNPLANHTNDSDLYEKVDI